MRMRCEDMGWWRNESTRKRRRPRAKAVPRAKGLGKFHTCLAAGMGIHRMPFEMSWPLLGMRTCEKA